MLATLLLSADTRPLRRAFLGLIDTLLRTEIIGREEIAREWQAAVANGECHPTAVRFYVLMALVNPHFADFVRVLCENGDHDRVLCFQQWVNIESTKLFAGLDPDFEQCRQLASERAYPSVGVFVLTAITIYGCQWDPHGYRIERRLEAKYRRERGMRPLTRT